MLKLHVWEGCWFKIQIFLIWNYDSHVCICNKMKMPTAHLCGRCGSSRLLGLAAVIDLKRYNCPWIYYSTIGVGVALNITLAGIYSDNLCGSCWNRMNLYKMTSIWFISRCSTACPRKLSIKCRSIVFL